MTEDYEIVKVDYTNKQQSADLCSLLNRYAMDPKGGGEPIDPSTLASLPSHMQKFGNAFSFILYVTSDDGKRNPVALANCILGFSTFNARTLMNIHDMYVDCSVRGRGFSQKLLQHVEEYAREIGCCKLTLEVQDKNEVAMNAYKKFGFEGYVLDPVDGKAMFWQKKFNG